MINLPKVNCLRCGYFWTPNSNRLPKHCAKCNSPYWNKKRLTDRRHYIELEKQIKRLYEKNLSLKEVAEKLDVSPTLVMNYLKKMKIPRRSDRPRYKYIHLKSKMIKLYNEGLNFEEIAEKLGIPSGTTVKKYLVLFKVHMRDNKAHSKMGKRNPQWKGDNASKEAGRIRANHRYNCPSGKEIHHIDGNPLNNSPENIKFVTRREHMIIDGRLEKVIQRLKNR